MAGSTWFWYNITGPYSFRWFTPGAITGFVIFTISLPFLNSIPCQINRHPIRTPRLTLDCGCDAGHRGSHTASSQNAKVPYRHTSWQFHLHEPDRAATYPDRSMANKTRKSAGVLVHTRQYLTIPDVL
ncbi:hypothetical protein EJ03DRAFT_205412 [Teratosphaeria nubilosa]|uniref:Uncharacterized protein n=1 Tax=Teratosphaeria nubilosa TaxID=161662 RepID=A0A6G1KY47_9PEZI|nr:hypothetical protein EJ03DRAFT_205412 [Teratosphaeria nubilosa]